MIIASRLRSSSDTTILQVGQQRLALTVYYSVSMIKHLDIKEFREHGYLQEVNRQFFHPLGLALEVNVDEKTGEETLGGIWDYREDPEGIYFDGGYGLDREKCERVAQEQIAKSLTRWKALGYLIQPLEPQSLEPDDDGSVV